MHAELSAFVGRRVRSRADVDDIVQETLVRVLTGLPNLDDKRKLGGWMTRIARNAIADHYRRRTRTQRKDDAAADDPTFDPVGAESDQDARESLLAACVRPFVEGLDEPYRSALTLTDLQGMSQAEAARKLGLSHSGMKSRVQLGRAQLLAEVERCCEVQLDVRNHVQEFTPRQCGGCEGADC